MKNIMLAALLLFAAVFAFGQSAIRLPDASPAATAGQTIGITDLSITYHRPAVNKRKIWGGLLPFATPWRTGADENTTISFSTPVKIEGQTLPGGTYASAGRPPESRSHRFAKREGASCGALPRGSNVMKG